MAPNDHFRTKGLLYVLYALYATISPHRRTIQHCRGINNLTTWGGGEEVRLFTPEDPPRSLFHCVRPTVRIVKSAVGYECA